MKILLIGYGYWGRIIHKNLKDMGYGVVICETNPVASNLPLGTLNDQWFVSDYKQVKEEVDAVFVVTPCRNHHEVCKYFLEKGIPVFCEKPLTFTTKESEDLYRTSKEKGVRLFVDWIFTYNQQINKIKSIVDSGELGRVKSLFMRRLNKGPVRNDVNSLYDLSSHDLSIVFHLLGVENEVVTIASKSYKTNRMSKQDDSHFGVYSIGDTICTIHSSWEHPAKDRSCVFEFENGIVLWDDMTQSLSVNGKGVFFDEKELPLVNSIKMFLGKPSKEHDDYQEKLTMKVMGVLNHEIQ